MVTGSVALIVFETGIVIVCGVGASQNSGLSLPCIFFEVYRASSFLRHAFFHFAHCGLKPWAGARASNAYRPPGSCKGQEGASKLDGESQNGLSDLT